MSGGWLIAGVVVTVCGFAFGLAALITEIDWRLANMSRRRRRARAREFDPTALLRARLRASRERP